MAFMHVLDKVDQLAKLLKSLQPLPFERQNILDKKFRLEFNYNSNHIEGNTLTYGETELLLIFDDTKGNHQMREYEEMKAHDVAYKIVEDWATDKERPLTEQQIKNLNEVILVRPYWKDAMTSEGQATRRQIKIGDYKDMPNSVRLQNGEMFHYASPTETPIKMQELIDWYRNEEKALHPVTLAAMLHYNFVRIHPFDDGNGRIARLLLNYVLLRNDLPPVIIKSADKANYLQALHLADIGDMEAFIEYIAEQLVWSLEISIKAARGESIDEPGDLDKKLAALKNKLGQKNDEKLELRYGLNTITNIIKSITPLIKQWENKLKEFDVFFYSRKNWINLLETEVYNGHVVQEGIDLYETFNFIIDENIEEIIGFITHDSKLAIRGIEFISTFINLRELNNDKKYNAGSIFITFYSNVYEIKVSGIEKPIQKLYSEEINDSEIELIIEKMGMRLYNVIEKEIEG